jgi:hypothetical protein
MAWMRELRMIERDLDVIPARWLWTKTCGLIGNLRDPHTSIYLERELASSQDGAACCARYMLTVPVREVEHVCGRDRECDGDALVTIKLQMRRLKPTQDILCAGDERAWRLLCDILQDVRRPHVVIESGCH